MIEIQITKCPQVTWSLQLCNTSKPNQKLPKLQYFKVLLISLYNPYSSSQIPHTDCFQGWSNQRHVTETTLYDAGTGTCIISTLPVLVNDPSLPMTDVILKNELPTGILILLGIKKQCETTSMNKHIVSPLLSHRPLHILEVNCYFNI